jgi:DNA polymerase alpha subunit B
MTSKTLDQEQIRSAFKEKGTEIQSDEILQKCWQLAVTYSFSLKDLLDYWETYLVNHQHPSNYPLNAETMPKFVSFVHAEHERKQRQQRRGVNRERVHNYTKDTLQLLNSYYDASHLSSIPPPDRSPSDEEDQQMSVSDAEEAAMDTSPRRGQRTDSGKIDETFNSSLVSLFSAEENTQTEVTSFTLLSSSSPLCSYMYDRLPAKIRALEEHFEHVANRLQVIHRLEDVVRLGPPQTHDTFTVIGRVCAIKATQNTSQTSMLFLKNGQRIKLDLVRLLNYSLFPGQIVAVRASNPYGVRLICQDIYTDASLPHYAQLPSAQQLQTSLRARAARIILASGPFTAPNNWKYDPLMDLLSSKQPDLLVLMGPFVDCEHTKVKEECDVTYTFEMQFMKVYKELRKYAERSPHTHVVVVPSLRDVHHDAVFPQPPFTIAPSPDVPSNLHFVPNPAYFLFNGILIGACSTDVLRHLAAEEVSVTNANQKVDRFVHLTQHLIHQQSFYPLFPPAAVEDVVPLHVSELRRVTFADLPHTPDILLFASDFHCFARKVDNVLCVNAGRALKGQSGHYAEFSILADPTQTPTTPIVDRTRVDICRL